MIDQKRIRQERIKSHFGSRQLRIKTIANVKPNSECPKIGNRGGTHPESGGSRLGILALVMLFVLFSRMGGANEGELEFEVVDEKTGDPIAARVELTRPQLVSPDLRNRGRASRISATRVVRPLPARGTVPTSFGFVMDGHVNLKLKEGPYEFRVTHGPEYRVVRGNFTIEKTSEDGHTVALPRILDMTAFGWTSLDCLVPASAHDLEPRMRGADLDIAWTTQGHPVIARPIGGLVIYSGGRPKESGNESAGNQEAVPDTKDDDDLAALNNLASLDSDSSGATRVAIENPFAWPLPVYLASQRVDGTFVLGDWLRLDKTLTRPSSGRSLSDRQSRDNRTLGREAEQIYWEMLNVGFRMAPLAGTGDEAGEHPVGYNRLYVHHARDEQLTSQTEHLDVSGATIWNQVWQGNSFATNGPLLQPRLGGHVPGHVFELNEDATMSLTPEVTVTVRDPVEYLEVIVNGMVHYTAKLDEFAKAGGRISPITVRQPGWALIRIVTLHEGHFRAATSAPWYFEVNGKRRVSKRSVEFFQSWLADYESELKSRQNKTNHVDLSKYAPFIRASRKYWQTQLKHSTTR